MSWDSALEIAVPGVVVPALVSLGVSWLLGRLRPEETYRRYSSAVGFAAGFVTGYVLLPEWAALQPDRHWHWLPYLAAAAAITGPIGRAAGVAVVERWLLTLVVSIAAAWFLVPTWSSLAPSRAFWLCALAGQLILLTVFCDPLPQRVGGRTLLWSVCATSLVVTMTIAACVSLTYARIAGVSFGALAGVCITSLRTSNDIAVSALVPTAMVTVGGIAFVGCIEPQQAVLGLLLLPAVPAALWLRSVGPLRRLTNFRAAAVDAAIVVTLLLGVAALTYFTT